MFHISVYVLRRNLPDEAYQGNLSADESFHGNPSKQNYWSGMISLAHRHKEVCVQAVFRQLISLVLKYILWLTMPKMPGTFSYIGLNFLHSFVFDFAFHSRPLHLSFLLIRKCILQIGALPGHKCISKNEAAIFLLTFRNFQCLILAVTLNHNFLRLVSGHHLRAISNGTRPSRIFVVLVLLDRLQFQARYSQRTRINHKGALIATVWTVLNDRIWTIWNTKLNHLLFNCLLQIHNRFRLRHILSALNTRLGAVM